MNTFKKDRQYIKFCAYGFLKNLRFYDAFLLLYFLEIGVSFGQIGILYAAREIIINLAEIPSGIIADTYGRKNALIAAFGLYILSFFVFYFSTDFNLLLSAMILFGIGDAFRSGTHKGMIMDYLKLKQWENHKIDYYGHTRSWSQIGSAISALMAGFLVFYSGSYRLIYLFSVIPYVLNCINIFSYPSELNHSEKLIYKGKNKTIFSVFKNFFRSVKNPLVFKIINSAALHTAFLKAIKDYIQPLMVQVAVLIPIMLVVDPKRKSGLVIGVLYFFIYLLTSLASKISFRVSKLRIKNISKTTLLVGIGSGVVCGLLMNFELWIAALIMFVIIYVIENLRKPILTATLADSIPNEILTSVLSAQSFYRTIITSMLAVAFGFIADIYGIGISLASVSIVLLCLIALIQVPFFKFKTR